MNKKDLWQNLVSYQFDHLVPTHLWDEILAQFGAKQAPLKAFVNKLHRKLGWQRTFALRAIHEYKKFVYLAVISESGVTPSKIIDQVWHEHLLFSAGYRKFCEKVIEYDLDHHPELVPFSGQTDNFQTQYFSTLALYEREFGKAPPDDIWSTTKFQKAKRTDSGNDSSFLAMSSGGETGTLVSMMEESDSSGFEFGGGESGGGGAGDSWGDAGGDSSSGDSDGGSDGGGSSCSSSCGSSCGGD